LIRRIKWSGRPKRQDAPRALPRIRKRIGKMTALRSKIADAETTRERRQVQQNPAGALKFHGNRFTEAGMLTALQICGDSISVFIELLEYRQTPGSTKRAARGVPDSYVRRCFVTRRKKLWPNDFRL